MSEAKKNLLVRNKSKHFPYYAYAGDGWLDGRSVTEDNRNWATTTDYDFSCELKAGTYTLTAECDGPDASLNDFVRIQSSSDVFYSAKFTAGAGISQPLTFEVTDETSGTWRFVGKRRGARWRVALYEGATAYAWSPYVGEELAGGGAQMSANLWSDSMANMAIRADGTYLVGKAGTAEFTSNVTSLDSLTENQTIHMGVSLKGACVLKPFVEYKDAAGNTNCVGFPAWQPTDTWQRFEGTCVVPSGMTVVNVGFNNSGATGDIEVSNPVFCYGAAPIVLAIAGKDMWQLCSGGSGVGLGVVGQLEAYS